MGTHNSCFHSSFFRTMLILLPVPTTRNRSEKKVAVIVSGVVSVSLVESIMVDLLCTFF